MDTTIYTGYALTTEQHGYVTVTRDFFSRDLCYWPCSNQASPSMSYTNDEADRLVVWLNHNFPNIGATVKPLRYCNGEWIDHP